MGAKAVTWHGQAMSSSGRIWASVAVVLLAVACQSRRYLEDFHPESYTPGLSFYTPEQVTAGSESNFSPDLSPNGEYVFYTSDRGGNKDLWVKRTVGGFGRPVTNHSADDFAPVLSPDGNHVAFISRRTDAAGDVHILKLGRSWAKFFGNPEGTVLDISSPQTEDTNPSWFPGSDRVVFAARLPGDKQPALMVASLETLTPEPLADLKGDQPSVSPDGTMVAYVNLGALYIYHMDTRKIEQVTAGGLLQDGQPRFSGDGKSLLFIRYSDDTNGDGKLDGDDQPTIWRLDLALQRQAKQRENYLIMPLTAASFAAYSPQIRGPYLYAALKTESGLDIFRFPEFGQSKLSTDMAVVLAQFDQRSNEYEKSLILRRAEAAFALAHQDDLAAECALRELQWIVEHGRNAEAKWIYAKLKAQSGFDPAIQAMADLAMILLDLEPIGYPKFTENLTAEQSQKLAELLISTENIAKNNKSSKRIIGQSELLKAQILAAQRQYFAANQLLAQVAKSYGGDRRLAAEAAYYAGVITPATADDDTAVKVLREVAAKYPDQREVARRAARAAISLLERHDDRLEQLVALRVSAKSIPLMPALAHMRIAEIFLAEGKEAVAANELRQIIDLYPESPEIMVEAATRLLPLDLKAERFELAESTLKRLTQGLEHGRPEYIAQAKDLLFAFYLSRGEDLLKLREPGLALKVYALVLAQDKQNISAHRGRIDAAFMNQTLGDLVEEYARHVSEQPQSAEWVYIYGYAKTYAIDQAVGPSARLAAIDEATELVERARQLNGQILQIHQTLGWLYMQKNFTVWQYYRSGSMVGSLSQRGSLVRDFFGAGDPDWRELAIEAYQNAYFLSQPASVERAGLAQNLGQAYYSLHNYKKCLDYYLQRVHLLPVIPMRDARAEAILFERAGRSAFQIDELGLAADLQRQALAAWERVGKDERIAYSLDALALSRREQGDFIEASTLYERLRRIQERTGQEVNLVGTLSNLAYCAFMRQDYSGALALFDKAEAALDLVLHSPDKLAAEEAKKSKDTSIKIALGGGSSAAKGFDFLTRRLLILSFRAEIYEKMGRLDLALATNEERLKVLQDASGQDKKHLAESEALVDNAIGDLRLKAGFHSGAKSAFAAAVDAAKVAAGDDQKLSSPGELTNRINRARVALRLASLALLGSKELAGELADLDATSAQLRPIYQSGVKAQGRPLATSLELASSLRLAAGGGKTDAAAKTGLEESLAVYKAIAAPPATSLGAVLAYQHFVPGVTTEGETQWKSLAQAGSTTKAFEALDRWIASGGMLRTPPDRRLARQLFETQLDAAWTNPDAAVALTLVRRFALMRLSDMAQRSGLDQARSHKLLALRDTAQIFKALGDTDAALWVHKSLAGDVYAVLMAKGKASTGRGRVSPKQSLDAASYARILESTGLSKAMPEQGGTVFLIPDQELFEVPWEQLGGANGPLQQRLLAFVPALDLLPEFVQGRRLGKGNVGYVGKDPPAPTFASANAKRTLQAVPLEAPAPLLERLTPYDLLHIDLPLWLNDVEPGESAVAAGLKGARANQSDLPLKRLAGSTLPSATAVIYGKVERANRDLDASGEGHDGWLFLSLAHLSAGVPTVFMADAKRPPVWPAFYAALATSSVGEAAAAAQLSGRVLGYPGIAAKDEESFAKEQLPKALDAADDAKADQDFDTAAVLYRRSLYDAQRLSKGDSEDMALKGLVQSLVQKRDYEGALPFQLRLAERLNPAAQTPVTAGAKKEEKDPVDYARSLLEAAAIAVKGSQADVASRLLDQAEVVFKAEDMPDQLGKVWQYRAINFENQHSYADTLAAYEQARAFYAKVKPDEAANQLLNIGNVYNRDLSDSVKALEYYTQAADAFKALKKQDLYLSVLIDKSSTLMTIGDLDAASAILEREVIPNIDRVKQTVLWVRASQMLTNAYFRAGLFQEAKDRNELTIAAAALVKVQLARIGLQVDAMGMKAMIAGKLGQYKSAFSEFQAAVKIAQEYKLQGPLASLYNNYGFWAREYGAVDQSIAFFEAALRLDTDLKSRSSIAFDHRNMGLSIILKGDFNRAKDLLKDALAVSEELHLVYNEAYCQFGLGDIAMREGQWGDAEAFFRKALAISVKGAMRDFVWRAHAGIAVAQHKRDAQNEAAASYAEALKVIEAMSAGLKSEDSRSGFISDAGVQQVYGGYSAVLTQLGQYEQAWTVSERGRGRAFIDALGTQRRHLKVPTNPQEKAQWGNFSLVDAITKEELSRLLGPGTALIEYQVTTDHLLIWWLKDGLISGKAVPMQAKDLLAKVREYRELMQNFSSTDYLGKELADLLLTPVLSQIGDIKHLAIVPHGSLHFLPFAALPLGPSEDVIDRFAVSYLTSATMARFTLDPKPRHLSASTRILALANPTGETTAAQALPFASKEVEVMGRYFPARDQRQGAAATKAAVREWAPKLDVLHLATHAEFRPNDPAESRLFLASKSGEEGDLSVADIFALESRADLVTLSACDSGLGRLSSGDEIVGMERAFFYAGANTVVSSLWRISDVASAVLMKRFYRYLAAGESRAEAMRHAQKVVRRYFNHPAYWSSFRVVGEPR